MGGNYYSQNCGIKLLVEKYRKEFRVADNSKDHTEQRIGWGEKKEASFFDKKNMVL